MNKNWAKNCAQIWQKMCKKLDKICTKIWQRIGKIYCAKLLNHLLNRKGNSVLLSEMIPLLNKCQITHLKMPFYPKWVNYTMYTNHVTWIIEIILISFFRNYLENRMSNQKFKIPGKKPGMQQDRHSSLQNYILS